MPPHRPGPTPTQPHQVAVLALDGVVAFDLGVPPQVFYAAQDRDGFRPYRVRVVTPDAAPVRTSAGYQAVGEHGLELLDEADTVVVPGIMHRSPMLTGTPQVREALRRAAGHARVMSICTGAFLLAEAGLLDG